MGLKEVLKSTFTSAKHDTSSIDLKLNIFPPGGTSSPVREIQYAEHFTVKSNTKDWPSGARI